jgi:hypothetical protein
MEEAAIVEIVEFPGFQIEPVDSNRRLAVFGPVGQAAGVGQVIAVELQQ